MKLLLDENAPRDILVYLSGHNIPIRHILNTNYFGSNDEVIFKHALHEKMTIITYDNDFLTDKFLNQSHYGIIFLRTREKDFKSIARLILSELKNHSSLKDKVIIIE